VGKMVTICRFSRENQQSKSFQTRPRPAAEETAAGKAAAAAAEEKPHRKPQRYFYFFKNRKYLKYHHICREKLDTCGVIQVCRL